MARIIGEDKLYKELKKLPKRTQGRRLDAAVRLAAEVVAEQAQINAPVMNLSDYPKSEHEWLRAQGHPGRLRRAIGWKKDSRKSTPENSVYNVGYDPGRSRDDPTGAYYGGMYEVGGPKVAARPYLRPGLAQKADEASQIIIRRLLRGLGF